MKQSFWDKPVTLFEFIALVSIIILSGVAISLFVALNDAKTSASTASANTHALADKADKLAIKADRADQCLDQLSQYFMMPISDNEKLRCYVQCTYIGTNMDDSATPRTSMGCYDQCMNPPVPNDSKSYE